MAPGLLASPRTAKTILLTGGTGYVGSLILSALLIDSDAEIIVLLRRNNTEEDLLEPLRVECAASGYDIDHTKDQRLVFMALPDSADELDALARALASRRPDDLIHCAGCVDYYDQKKLHEGNVVLTERMLELAGKLDVKRFVYISTAYSGGYGNAPVRESLHGDPVADPTEYTRTKRLAEYRVAQSGVPFIIIRPSILIGHSQTGRYSGKPYGLYQSWMGLERLLCNQYHEDMYTVGNGEPVNLIHQDVFLRTFMYAHRFLPDGAIMNLVADAGTSPTLGDLRTLWADIVKPKRVLVYAKVADIPIERLHPRQRAYLILADKNLEIAMHPWQFDTGWLSTMRQGGFAPGDTTIDTVKICLDRFVRSSKILQNYLHTYQETLPESSTVLDMTQPLQA